MTKTLIPVLLLIIVIICITLSGCSAHSQPVIWHASDIHYIAPELIEDRLQFIQLMENADGKMTHRIDDIADEFISEALKAGPDCVILSGDLTLNGAKESHIAFAGKLRALKEAGIEVLVMPGNHDIRGAAYRFREEGVEGFPAATPEEFREIYYDFGYSGALSTDPSSLSYMYELPGNVRILVIDTNSSLRGSVSGSTFKWIEEQLKASEGFDVISVTHQNLFVHNPMFRFGYQINNADKLEQMLSKYGIQLNLSGHLHVQHITEENGIADIAVSSLAVAPNQYGVLKNRTYETRKLNLDIGADEFFDSCSRRKMKFDDKELLETAVKLNREYFAGRVSEADADRAMELSEGGEGLNRYLSTIIAEKGKNYNKFCLPKK